MRRQKIKKQLQYIAEQFHSFLQDEIFPMISSLAVKQLADPMIYSLQNQGKRVRVALVFFCAGLRLDVQKHKAAYYAAAAIEAIHTYSLIHDDLPAMDDDAMRRGKPSCHVQFSEWSAILAGDALQSFAFELLAKASQYDPTIDLRNILFSLARGSGLSGMAAGQALDLDAEKGSLLENSDMDQETLVTKIHSKKTAALFCAACKIGALLSGLGSEVELASYCEYGQKLGLLFQIQDDILDVLGDPKKLGKATSKDVNKLTYPSVFGLEKSQRIARSIKEEIAHLVDHLPNGSRSDTSYYEELKQFPVYVLERRL